MKHGNELEMKNQGEVEMNSKKELEMNSGIYFEAISKADPNIMISGETTVEYLKNDESPLQFYDQTNQLSWYMPKNPFDMDTDMQSYTNYEALKEAFNCDGLLLQYLADYATENKTIKRGNYTLKINPKGADTMKETEVKFINTETITDVIENINNQVEKYNKLGGNNEIIRIIQKDNLILLQAKDNGDRVIYHINKDYPEPSILFSEIISYSKSKNIPYKFIEG